SVDMPMGRFTLDRAPGKVAFISGGVGITPIRSICQYVKEMNFDKDIVLIYGNHRQGDIIFKEEFDEMAAGDLPLKVVHVLDQPLGEWSGYTGLISKDIIVKEIPDCPERTFFLCGPPKMVECLSSLLQKELSIAKERIIIENFSGY
ncbi:MAG: hypothetical protein AB1650_00950, partial [Candidatus Omnitrophota bacterium]